MNIQLVAFGFGCLLLMVAILGGGFEVKELKVPKVGRAPRFAACLFGVLFVFLGIKPDLSLNAAPVAAAPQTAQQSMPPAPAPVATPVAASNVVPQPIQVATSLANPDTSARAPQQVQSSNEPAASEVQAKQARPAAAARKRTKDLPWEQRPRELWRRFKAARG